MSPKNTLDQLVERTAGLQPWRKAFHAFNGLAVAIAIEGLGLTSSVALWILGPVAGALLLVDLLRLSHRKSNELFFRVFSRLASPREARGIASSTWYALGLVVTLALFPLQHAVSGILLLALADPAASLVGHRWGRRPLLGGSVVGTAAGLAVAGLVLTLRHPLPVAAVAAVVVALAERGSWPLDDNFTIPVAGAAATTFATLVLA